MVLFALFALSFSLVALKIYNNRRQQKRFDNSEFRILAHTRSFRSADFSQYRTGSIDILGG
jgi:hypothetical protein